MSIVQVCNVMSINSFHHIWPTRCWVIDIFFLIDIPWIMWTSKPLIVGSVYSSTNTASSIGLLVHLVLQEVVPCSSLQHGFAIPCTADMVHIASFATVLRLKSWLLVVSEQAHQIFVTIVISHTLVSTYRGKYHMVCFWCTMQCWCIKLNIVWN